MAVRGLRHRPLAMISCRPGVGLAEVGGRRVTELVQTPAGRGVGAGVMVEQDQGAVVAEAGSAGVRAQVFAARPARGAEPGTSGPVASADEPG
jgi:hypothetical protein